MCAFPTPTWAAGDHIPLQTPTEETRAITIPECEAVLKLPTPASDAQLDEKGESWRKDAFARTRGDPVGFWRKFTEKLGCFEQTWMEYGFDPYILDLMEEDQCCVGRYAFGAVLHNLFMSAKQLHGDNAIEAVYNRMKATKCVKMCRVMDLVLLGYNY